MSPGYQQADAFADTPSAGVAINLQTSQLERNRPVNSVLKRIALGVGGLGSFPGPVKLDTRHCFDMLLCCVAQTLSWATQAPVLPRRSAAKMRPTTRYTLRRITASIIIDLI